MLARGVVPVGKRQDSARITRRKIVQAAKELHEKRGLSNVSVDEIVAEAGVSKGSFYVYFRRKEDISAEIELLRFDELKDSLEHAPGTAVEKIGRFLTESVRYIQEQGLALCKEWMKSAVSPIDEAGPGMVKMNFDREYILQTVHQAQECGELDNGAPAEALADLILADYYGMVTLWSMTNGRFPIQERIENFADTLNTILKPYWREEMS